MFALERQKLILESLNTNGAVWVSKLSTELGVTEETIRRDLEKLEKQEVLVRTHGGAIPITESSYELSLEKRKKTNSAAKERLAKAAVEHLVPGDTIFLDSSTTTFYIAKELKRFKKITVITNSLRVINELSGIDTIKLISVGGHVSNNQSLVGSTAESAVRNSFFAEKFFFSSKGFSFETGVLESNEFECFIKQEMLKNSNKKYYLCDSTKIGRVGAHKLAPLSNIDYLITDADLNKNDKEILNQAEIKLIKV
ncbi:MAG: DeoR/GlpR transcriptional regulator [Clostridia bacterium]|nr:DeoR/GlpR transcriptional regulator [Clostridia bacterium]